MKSLTFGSKKQVFELYLVVTKGKSTYLLKRSYKLIRKYKERKKYHIGCSQLSPRDESEEKNE